MEIPETSTTENLQRRALQSFIVGNQELAQLEVLASRFNIFEALGVVRDERKYSNFLGFLLNPTADHGLGDRFLKRILQAALECGPSVAQLGPIDIDLFDLSHAEVHIERSDIDILVSDDQNDLYVIIENKVHSSEHSDQLHKYYELISQRNPTPSTVFGIYLTIDGELPEKEEDRKHYAPMSYSVVRRSLDQLCLAPDLRIEKEVRFAIDQYREVLGRHFMADEQIKELCEKIYKQHKKAIDLIISNLPNQREVAREKLIELIKANESSLTLENDPSTAYVRFIPKVLNIDYFQGGSGYTSSGRMILFEFTIRRKSVVLTLEMGPGDSEKRKRIYEFACKNAKILHVEAKFYEKWQSLYKKVFVTGLDGDVDREQLIETIEAKWKEFLDSDLPRIQEIFLAHPWPAEATESQKANSDN
jgi:hypothetical protein